MELNDVRPTSNFLRNWRNSIVYICKIKIKKKKIPFTSDLVATVTLRRIRSKTHETHGPARTPQGSHRAPRVRRIHTHTRKRIPLSFSPLSRSAGWQPGLPSSLPPPPYATGAPKRRTLLQTGSFVCYTVACALKQYAYCGRRGTTVIQRQRRFFPRVRRTRCNIQRPWLLWLANRRIVNRDSVRPRSDGDLTTMDKHADRLDSWAATEPENESTWSSRNESEYEHSCFFRTRLIVEQGKTNMGGEVPVFYFSFYLHFPFTQLMQSIIYYVKHFIHYLINRHAVVHL